MLTLAAPLVLATALAADPEPTIGDRVESIDVAHWVRVEDKSPRGEFTPVTALEGGRVYVFEFWATWCAPCVAQMEKVSELQRDYRDKGVTVIGLTEETLPHVVEFLHRKERTTGRTHYERARYLMGVDPDGSAMASLIPVELRTVRPMAVILDREGRIAFTGVPTSDEFKVALDAIVAGMWDTESYAERARVARERQAEQDRIIADEDWPDAKEQFWDDDEYLARIAFAIAFNYGNQIEDADPDVALEYAERAVELTDGRSVFALHALARVHWNEGNKARALSTQRRAVAVLNASEGDYGNAQYIRQALEQYEQGQ